MRRRAEPQRAQQMAKLRLAVFRAHPERLEHFLLQLRFVNSNAAAAELDAVQNNVVSFRADVWEFPGFKECHVLGFRARKRMKHGVPFVFFRTPLEERKVCYP